MQNERKRPRSGPQYMQPNGSFGSDVPNYLRPISPTPAPPPRSQGIQLSDDAARKIADALRIFLHEPRRRK